MIADDAGQSLHDRSTRGEALTAEEGERLDLWYARIDQDEQTALAKAVPSRQIALLRQIDAALAQLSTLTQRIQIQAAENESLRREIAALRRQLTQRHMTQQA